MEEFLLYITIFLSGVIFFQKRKIKKLEREAIDTKDAVLKVEQDNIKKEKEQIKKEVKKLKPDKVNKEEKAEDYWKDKL